MNVLRAACCGLLGLALSCGSGDSGSTTPTPQLCDGRPAADTLGTLRMIGGQDQCALPSAPLPSPLRLRVVDGGGAPVAAALVRWAVVIGGGTLTADSSITNGQGIATMHWTIGAAVGGQFVRATSAASSDTVLFHATAQGAMTVLAGGENVAERYTSDLWVHGGYAYTGTWGIRASKGNAVKVWSVGAGIALVDSIVLDSVLTISDDEVSADGALLLVTAEIGARSGLYIYSLADPAHPALVGAEVIGGYGLHTGTFADIGGQRYVFAAKDPNSPALMVFRVQPDSTDPIAVVATIAQPVNYGIHDTYVRDGLAFVSDWDSGMRIYDVGDGRAAGSPAAPHLIGSITTSSDGLSCNCVHNSWWYHAPDSSARYLFIGQEGPGAVGSASSGDIHVVDVSNLASPVEVAFYHLAGAGVHNFWMDETRGILYAAYYNGGVVALDVTGTLSGELASREIARLQPGGSGNTYVWGVMLANGSLWVSDMVSGFWKVSVP